MIGIYDSSTKLVTKNLVLWQDFGWDSCYSGSGTSTKNLANPSGLGNGTVSGSPTFTSGVFEFTGSEYISFGPDASIRPTSTLSVGAWVYFNSLAGDQRPVSDWHQGVEDRWIFYVASGTEFWWYVNGTAATYTDSSGFGTGTWQYIVGTFDSTLGSANVKLYANGNLVGQTDNGGTLPSPTGSWDVECGQETAQPGSGIDGKISQVQIWDRALTATEITQNFEAHRSRYGV